MAWQALEDGENNFDVIIVGAGISGINFGYRLQERNPDLKYAILEGRHEIGGTWSLFKYPGIRSDSDLHTFGFSWRPWVEKGAIAEGHLIRNYVKESASLHGIDKKIRFNHMVKAAQYSSDEKAWTLDVIDNGTQSKQYKARFMLLCTGYYDYNVPLQSTIPGIDTFKGTVLHPQFWPENQDYSGKNVVVIGSGATAVTVLPVMAKKAAHVTMLQRSPGYVVSLQSEDGLEWLLRATLSSWAPALMHRLFHIKWVMSSLLLTTFCKYFPRLAKKLVSQRMAKELPAEIPCDPHFNPTYYPWEQRMCLCPDGDFFEGLRSGRSSVETGVIETVTPNSIKLASGKELHPDIIVTATGLKMQFAGGMSVTVDGKPFDIPQKFIWKGLMLEDLPNAAFSIGYVDASWTLGADATAQLVCRMLNQMRKEGVVEVTPRRSEQEKSKMQPISLLRLSSTYVSKAQAVTPKSGDRGQWVPRSYYYRDIMSAWYGDIKTSTEWVKSA